MGVSDRRRRSLFIYSVPMVQGWAVLWGRHSPMQAAYLLLYATLLPFNMLCTNGHAGATERLVQSTADGHDTNREVLKKVALGACIARCDKGKPSDCWDSCLHNHTEGKYYWAPGPHTRFSHKPEVELGPKGKYRFRWSDAVNQSQQHWESLVYGVFWASDTQDWTCLYLNTSQECELDATMLAQRNRPRLLVNAMSRDGVIAEETLLPVLPVQDDITRGEKTPGASLYRVIVSSKNETLRVCISWPVTVGRVNQYIVHWARLTCQSNPVFPGCDEPAQHWAKTLTASGSKQNLTRRYCLPWKSITFNSRYWVQVDHGNAEGKRIGFITPTCKFPDRKTFTRCLNNSTPQNKHMHEVLKPWYINYTCLAVHARTGEALVNLSWHLPGHYNTTGIIYTIRTLTVPTFHPNRTSKQLGVSSVTTRDPYLDVTLKPHSDYTFTATASVKHRGGGTLTFVSRQLVINTTTVQRSQSNETCEEFEVPVVGLLVPTTSVRWYLLVTFVAIGGVVILTSVILLVLRRFNRLRFTLRMTSIRANSNSYKSSPELGNRLENELMCLQDDWEINPSQVQICTELGRGAFGRVMTGLYNGVKVAIKILKEDAPPFYKEDLLQEITLMKDLGQHPNIVLLIGACTQREPTALILEYMPYGNLQSFLTKCRTEGELMFPNSQGADEMSVVYAVIDEDGEVEQWTIAPADLLSFARQVTKAMEFLGEHQIIHRDLAARNVLLGFNKHVKVSDFGLARTVSEPGDAYHKLTAGKLPLKWMAIESLQDRVFTTASDVWSFGVLLWELVTSGASPYPGIALADLYMLLASGYRMERPRNCSDSLHELMLGCWREDPSERPSFTELRLALEEMLAKDTNYLDLENIDIPVHQSESSSCETSPLHRQTGPQVVPAIMHVQDCRDF